MRDPASETEPPPPTAERAARRRVKAVNQPRLLDWIAGLAAASVAPLLLIYVIGLITESRLPQFPSVALVPFNLGWSLSLLLNRVELELTPERIVIRSRWRRVIRAHPRELVLPGDAAVVAAGGLIRVGGWSAGIWTLKRIAAVTKEAGIPLEIPKPQTQTRRLVTLLGAFLVVAAGLVVFVVVAEGVGTLARGKTLAFIELNDIFLSVGASIAAAISLAVLWRRLRVERTVAADAIEPIGGR